MADINCRLELKKIQEVKIETFIGASILRISSNHFIYTGFADQVKGKAFGIRKYDLDLKPVEEYAIPYGQGPNECLNPVVVGGNDDEIMVVDTMAQKYYIYNGDFSSRYEIANRLYESILAYGLYYSPEKKIAVMGTWIRAKGNLAFLKIYRRDIKNKSFEDHLLYSGSLEGFVGEGRLNWGEPFHFRVIGDHLFILEANRYKVMKMDLNGNILQSIRVTNIPGRSFSRKELDGWVKESKLPPELTFPDNLWPACWIIVINDGFAVGRREDYNVMADRGWIKVDYFDLELNYLGKTKVPWFDYWKDPKWGQEILERRFGFGDKYLFMVESREQGDDEDFFLLKWEFK